MRSWLVALALVICVSLLVAFGPLGARASSGNMSEDDFRKLEQTWLDAASVPDLPLLRKMFSEDFMGHRSAEEYSARTMWFPRME